MNQTLSISLTSPAPPDTRDSLRIEQEEWGKHVGTVTKQDVMDMFSSLALGTAAPTLDCGLNADGSMSCLIYAYPAYASLNYRLKTSKGTLTGRKIERIDESEGVMLHGSSTAELKYPAQSIVSADWQGDVFNTELTRLSPKPTISISGSTVTVSQRVHGTIIVEYKLVRHTSTLTVRPRSGTTENKYNSVVYGLFKDGITWKDIATPPDADYLSEGVPCGYGLGGVYGGGGSTTIGDNDGGGDDGEGFEPPTDTSGEDRDIKVDYCTQEVLSDSAGILDK